MKISLDFRHPWSDLDHVAHIQREDLNGKQARRVIEAAEAELGKSIYRNLYCSFWDWKQAHAKNAADPLSEWEKAVQERYRLEALCKRYEWRTYTEKDLEDLTPEEWECVDPWDICILSDFERKRYNV